MDTFLAPIEHPKGAVMRMAYAMARQQFGRSARWWLVASEHFYNMTNIGLNIHSDMLSDIALKR